MWWWTYGFEKLEVNYYFPPILVTALSLYKCGGSCCKTCLFFVCLQTPTLFFASKTGRKRIKHHHTCWLCKLCVPFLKFMRVILFCRENKWTHVCVCIDSYTHSYESVVDCMYVYYGFWQRVVSVISLPCHGWNLAVMLVLTHFHFQIPSICSN